MSDTLPDWRRALGQPCATGRLRHAPEDFRVVELPMVEPSGDGDHVLLCVEKRDRNTDEVARALAHFAGVPARDVGYAGRKDRRAVTVQWFSVALAGRVLPDWSTVDVDGVRVLGWHRHRRKLRRGALAGNRFEIVVRDLDGGGDIAARLGRLARDGAPNYFGPQRFGRHGSNLDAARAWFSGGQAPRRRDRRSLVLSAARSAVFNAVLSARVAAGCWNVRVPGDLFALDGSRSTFADDAGETLDARLAAFDIHPTGPLPGRGGNAPRGEAAAIENAAMRDWEIFVTGLTGARVDAARRPLRMRVADLDWDLDDTTLRLRFALAPGCYATAVLREILDERFANAPA